MTAPEGSAGANVGAPDGDDTAAVSGERSPQEKAREGLEHLQTAARELIQAARAMLDVAEDLVNDPEAVATVAATVGSLGDLVRHRASGAPAGSATDRPADDGGEGDGRDRGDGPGGDEGVERITVL
ncbi:MAG TPA: hypothetical protein VIL48_19250 [Acidimicrobiales bacterium]